MIINPNVFSRFALTCAAVFALGAATLATSCSEDEPAPPVITITTEPTAPAALTEGKIPEETKLTVTASVSAEVPLTYQWYTHTSASNSGSTAINGATSASYTIPATLTEGKYYYSCEVSAQDAESKITSVVTVTVGAKDAPIITITTQPISPSFVEGYIPADTKLTVEANVTENALPSYQWYSHTSATNTEGTIIDGATTASYNLPTTLTPGTYYYFCELGAQNAQSIRTNVVTVTVDGYVAPMISITAQPVAPSNLIVDFIREDIKFAVEASVIQGNAPVEEATLSYQWYAASNNSFSGTPIDGAISASYTLPTDLTAGAHYYYCTLKAPGAQDKNSYMVYVNVLDAPLNARITWNGGRYYLTSDPKDAGLFFKFGSVTGLYSGKGKVQVLPADAEITELPFTISDIAWNPADATTYTEVPHYTTGDYSAGGVYARPITPESGFHTAANVKAGKGDPCRLVGLDLNKIKSSEAAALSSADIDNGRWRLPTMEENQSFSGQTAKVSYMNHWTTLNGVTGGTFPDTSSGAARFLPAVNLRSLTTVSMGTTGTYWTSTPSNPAYAYGLQFTNNMVDPAPLIYYSWPSAVRCVRQ